MPPCLCFTARAGRVKSNVLKHWHILKCNPNLQVSTILPPHIFWGPYKNIADFMTHSMKLLKKHDTWLPGPPNGNYKCGHCAHCDSTTNMKVFTLLNEYREAVKGDKQKQFLLLLLSCFYLTLI